MADKSPFGRKLIDKVKTKALGLDRPLTHKQKMENEAAKTAFEMRMQDRLRVGIPTVQQFRERKALEQKFSDLSEYVPKSKVKRLKKK